MEPLLRTVSPLRLAFLGNLRTTPVHLAITGSEVPATLVQLQRPGLRAAVCYSGILSKGLAYATWHFAVRQLGGSHAAVYQNVVTLVAVITAWTFLRKPVLPVQIAGGLILFAGLFLMRRGRRAIVRAESALNSAAAHTDVSQPD